MSDSDDDNDDNKINLSGWDRRKFGKILVVGVGGLALGSFASAKEEDCVVAGVPQEACTNSMPTWYGGGGTNANLYVDVVIVGAGLSGLIAARELKKANPDPAFKVLVLEANCRIGGRMYGQPTIEGGYVDFGGQWVGDTQEEMKALVKELKIRSFDSYEDGRSVQLWKGTKTAFNGDVAQLLGGCVAPNKFPKDPTIFAQCNKNPFSPVPFADCKHDAAEAKVWDALLKISRTVNPARPWETPGAVALDSTTFGEWLKEPWPDQPLAGPKSADYSRWLPTMQSHIGGSGAFEPDNVSLLHMAWTQRVGPQSETPELTLLCGGAGQIPKLLADGKYLHDRIMLNAPVSKITQRGEGQVLVTVSNMITGDSVAKARAVIVAIPPHLRGKITFAPELPPEYKAFRDKSNMGSLSKVHAVYKTAWWREKCLSGSAAGNLETCEFVADSSPPSGTPGILTAFIAGKRNDQLQGAQKSTIRKRVLEDFERYFGNHDLVFSNEIENFFYFPWKEQEWTGGAFTTHLGKNVWTTSGKVGWREPVGDIFWAGTETSDCWPGYFDGAIHAGKLAARCVLKKLQSTKNTTCDWEKCLEPA